MWFVHYDKEQGLHLEKKIAETFLNLLILPSLSTIYLHLKLTGKNRSIEHVLRRQEIQHTNPALWADQTENALQDPKHEASHTGVFQGFGGHKTVQCGVVFYLLQYRQQYKKTKSQVLH